jgi:hypothetical protein
VALIDNPVTGTRKPIEVKEAKQAIRTGKWPDEAALSIVCQDAERAETYQATKEWIMLWTTASTLYQSPFIVKYWEGTQTERANVPFFTVATAVNSLTPQIIKGLFYDDPPFLCQNKPGTSAQVARASQALLAYELDDLDFREQLRLGTTNALLYGTGMWKYSWEMFTKTQSSYKRKVQPMKVRSILGDEDIEIADQEEEIEEVIEEVEVHRPTFESIVDLKQVLVDPGLNQPDIRKAKYVIHRMYVTWEDLDKLRQRPGVNIPMTNDELLGLFFPPKEQPPVAQSLLQQQTPLWDARAEAPWFATTADPTAMPLELLERWDNNRYILVLQKKLVIASTENDFHQIPFFSIGWWDVPGAFWSMGLARTIGSEQRLQAGITNTWLDGISLILNGVYVRVKGQSVPTQNIRVAPGRVIEVDNKDSLKPLERMAPVPEAMQALQMSMTRTETTSGANEFATQGSAGASGHSNLARTAAGANLMAGGTGSRVEDFVEKLSSQVFVPFLCALHELNCQLMPLKVMRYILGEELDHEFMRERQGDVLELKNARLKFTISAAAKLLARRNMAQALPIMMQFLQAGPIVQGLAIAGKKIDVQELIRMMYEVSDWKNINDVVVDMTDEDKQRWMAAQQAGPAQVQAKSKMAMQQQDFINKSQLANDENIARASREVLRQALEQSATPEAVEGEPGGKGFGANV